MTDPSRQADALLTDHLTYTPLSLIDDIINAVNTIIYQALDAIEDGLLNVPPPQLGFKPSNTSKNASETSDVSDAAKNEIENGVHQLETLLESTVDKSFDKFEIYTLRNILTVPEDLGRWVRLGHYEGLQFPPSDLAATPESILDLRRKVQETTKLNLALRSKHAKNAATIAQLQNLLAAPSTNDNPTTSNSLAFLTQPQSGATASQSPFKTQTQFATSQLPALRQLVGDLRPKIDKLKDSRPGDIDSGSRREERRQYIEGGVRRVVEKGSFGNREGALDTVGMGRRGREDVEGLEAVIRVIGGTEKMES